MITHHVIMLAPFFCGGQGSARALSLAMQDELQRVFLYLSIVQSIKVELTSDHMGQLSLPGCISEPWISLDFLGYSWIFLDFLGFPWPNHFFSFYFL